MRFKHTIKAMATYGLMALLMGIASLYLTTFVGGPYDFSITVFTLRIFTSIVTIYLLLKVLHLILTDTYSSSIKSLTLLISSLAILFMVSDVGFMFVSRSFGTSYPLANQNWERHYWTPINSLGYRAPELKPELFKDKKNILIVGSSYTAGDGIADPKQRFSDKLEAKLPDEFAVHNLGLCGSEVRDAFKRLNEYSVEPDVLIFTHTTKSIKALLDHDAEVVPSYRLDEEINPVARFIVKNSYLVNYLFWKYYAPGHLARRYMANIEHNPMLLYLQKNKLLEHYSNLQKFADYCENKSIPLIVISFPSMDEHINLTEKVVSNPVVHYFNERNISTVSVFELVKDLPIKSRIINSSDAHPSVEVHHRIAEELYIILQDHDLI